MKKQVLQQVLQALCLSATITLGIPHSAHAQDMVSAVGTDGLEKTVSYDVASFTDIRDKKLEDVMKKMPGISTMSWDDSTSYMYNGMYIAKVYVNGLDILEGNYDPVYNMKPEDVERLEITENHVAIKVMRGMQYSNGASINVVLKDGTGARWTGSVKGGLGITPLLLNADVNAINIGSKLQSTVLFKADNTGLNFGGALSGFGGYEYGGMSASANGIDYSLKQFMNVEPSLAPLAADRVRFNRSGIFNVGSTLKLNDDYQVNFQLTYHTDRLTAESLDETTYYLDKGEQVVDVVGEHAKSHQQDVQADVTLLANTDTKYLRNQLHLGTRWNDVDKTITGTFPNDQHTNTTPLLIYNVFLYKRHLSQNILTLSVSTGIASRPQDMDVEKEDGLFAQHLKSLSAYGEASATLDTKLTDRLTLSLNGGASANHRTLDVDLTGVQGTEAPDIDSRLNIQNAFGSAALTYITDRMQAEVKLPVKYGHYDLTDKASEIDTRKSKLYLSPSLSVKYEASENLSLSADASVTSNEVQRMNLYPHLIFSNFRTATRGLPGITGSRNTSATLGASYMHPKTSVFVNGSLSYWGTDQKLIPVMDFTDAYIISGYRTGDNRSDWWEASADISKGIESLKGKIGLTANASLSKAKMERNGSLIPYTSTALTLAPYVNGRLNSWWNVVYQLNLSLSHMKMDDEDTSSETKSYTQTLEMIFSPWQRLNFSVLGEHYYTEFMDDVSKHLVLFDVKAEYNLSDRWQLILSARNILNQKTYNYTLMDSDRFTKSFTAYKIRPRNILLSLYYKF